MSKVNLAITIFLLGTSIFAANTTSLRTHSLELPNEQQLKLVWIPAGTFTMGSKVDAWEMPTRRLEVKRGFWMGRTEVTQAQYTSLMGKTDYEIRGDDLPAVSITFQGMQSFCEKLTKLSGKVVRLPSEAEWEYASRAGTQTRWFFGNDVSQLSRYGNFADMRHWNPDEKDKLFDDGHGRLSPVATYKPNPWGLFDMYGNAWEMTLDEYTEDYSQNDRSDDIKPYSGPNAANAFRTKRGGSWETKSYYTRSAARRSSRIVPETPDNDRGFRVVVE